MIQSFLFKQKKFWIVSLVALALSLPCIYFLIKPNGTYTYEGDRIFENGELVSDTVIFEQISLSQGIYQVELMYDTDTYLQYRCNVEDSSVFSGGLLTNGEHLYVGLDKTSFRIWLLEDTDTLQIHLSGNGEGALQTGDLIIYETNQLWVLLLFFIWLGAIFFCFIIFFIQYEHVIGIDKEKKTIFFLLSIIVLIASIPNLLGGNMAGADLTYHLQRIEGVKDGLLSGQFPIRIEPRWLFGYGYADGIMYCNFFLYIPAILRILGFTVVGAFNTYAILFNIATVGIAYFSFGRIFKNRYIGVVCSALYTLSIFRIYKFIITAAVGEGSAFTFFPLIVYGFYRVFTENPEEKQYKTAWMPLAFGFAGVLQTHVLSCEITVFITIFVLLLFIKKIRNKNTFFMLFKGAAGAVLFSLWYLVPFLDYYISEDMHIKHVSARTIQDRGLYITQLFFHFWEAGSNAELGEYGMQYSQAFGVGLILCVGFVLFGVMWFRKSFRTKNIHIISLGKLSFVASAILMFMSLNFFPWDKLQSLHPIAASLISSIQFPNRFLGWATVFLVLIFGCCLAVFVENQDRWKYYLGITCALIGITTSSMYLLDYSNRDYTLFAIYNEEAMGEGYISGGEYLIQGTVEETLGYHTFSNSSGIEVLSYEKGNLQASVSCSNVGDATEYVELPLLLYKGYKAWDTETGEELSLTYGENYNIRVLVPAGYSGELIVKFVSPFYWRIAEVISAICYLALIVFATKQFIVFLRAKEKQYVENV